jgi:hypothetical protein
MADMVSFSQTLTNVLLNGTNYLPWCRAVTISLGGRAKLGHIDGTSKKPAAAGDDLTTWQTNDHQVMSWIFNSMESQIYEIFAYSDSAKTLWDSLKEMYGQVNNASRIFELQQKLAKTKQNSDQSFIDHLSRLKKQLEELKQYRPPASTIEEYVRREEQDKVFLLLASLTSEYEEVKRDILMRVELSSFTIVCAIIQGEETRKRVMNSENKVLVPTETSALYLSSKTRWNKNKEKKVKFNCEHYHRDGHNKDRCSVLHPQLKPTKFRNTQAKIVVHTENSIVVGKNFQTQLDQLNRQLQALMESHTKISSVDMVKTELNIGNCYALFSL